MRLYVVRHGETDLNVVRRIQGPLLDPPLNARGAKQAEALARRLAEDGAFPRPDFCLSSPMRRATQTAEAIVRRLPMPWEVDERLVEYDWGVLNGQVDEGDVRKALEHHMGRWEAGHLDEAPERGESPRQAAARAMDALASRIPVVGPDGVLLLVAHGRLNRVLLAQLLHGSPARQEEIHQHNCGLTVLEGDGATWRLLVADDWSHGADLDAGETV